MRSSRRRAKVASTVERHLRIRDGVVRHLHGSSNGMRLPWSMGAILPIQVLQGCTLGRAPSVPIFGSYFPAWIICAVGGILVAVVLRFLFVAVGIDEHLIAPPLVYLCLAVGAGIALARFWMGSS